MTYDLQKRTIETLVGIGIELTFGDEGPGIVSRTPIPIEKAKRAVAALEAAGLRASWAPDNDDGHRRMAWLYVSPGDDFLTADYGSSDAAFAAAREAAAKQFAARIIGPSWRIEATPEGWRIVP